MNFKEIIKQEWEKEFPEAKGLYETCIFNMCYSSLVERICIRVWNETLIKVQDDICPKVQSSEDYEQFYDDVEKLKINEQGTDTTEV